MQERTLCANALGAQAESIRPQGGLLLLRYGWITCHESLP